MPLSNTYGPRGPVGSKTLPVNLLQSDRLCKSLLEYQNETHVGQSNLYAFITAKNHVGVDLLYVPCILLFGLPRKEHGHSFLQLALESVLFVKLPLMEAVPHGSLLSFRC